MDLLRSLPIGLYLEQPVTWLHRIDSRVKLGWLLSFLLTPIAATPEWRVAIVAGLILLTFASGLPFRAWRKQLGLILGFALLLFGITLFAPDGVNVTTQPRLPVNEFAIGQAASNSSAPLAADQAIASLPQPTNYQYVLLERGSIRITRRSVELAIRVGTLMFTLIYSTNLYLLTTAPEEITAGLDYLMQPLRRFLPVTEIVLTLTLALRFIPLVLEEVQNLVRSVRTRAINWKKLGFRGATQVWSAIAERLLDNLLLRAEQIASAMQVRGFTSPNQHQVKWHQFRLRFLDRLALAGIGVFWGIRFWVGG
ncbi:MAG: CbiQ family ECF transporter T component [Timaviella obliquedivisa GSE-PSE-MK23-08B]|jgi:energy-coupling factor transport system permease protein|nr:CbiQ family ECF transporter T component [Timaviella obliquedivisa GSE-PSE-MK23-08B]